MMGERPPPEPPRLGDTLNTGSSTGWTDEKHMHYITSLEESFVTQLYNGEVYSKGLLCLSPGVWHKTYYSEDGRNTEVHQGYWGMLGADGAESRLSQAEYLGSPSCSGYRKNSITSYMDDDASTYGSQQERTSFHSRPKNEGSAASYLRLHGHSLSWRTGYYYKENCHYPRSESSDQNFIDGEIEDSSEENRGYSEKQLKRAADTTED